VGHHLRITTSGNFVRLHSLLVISLLCILALGGSSTTKPTLSETDKIERLIYIVSQLKDCRFIRKDVEYDVTAAAQFMRGKWQSYKDQVKTARDFVICCSAGNFGTGTPYYVKHADGSRIPAGQFLSRQLDQIESPPATQPATQPR
jgi:hypothetical protein